MIKPDKSIRVLLVDDSGLVRDMIRDILESDPGIVVVGEAVNGEEAIAKVTSLKPDIVTMDIEMPVMGGLEAIEKIIAEHPVPILVVTALTGVRTAFAAISKGALDVIEKPDISPENVQKLIHKIRYLARVDISAHLQRLGGTGLRRLRRCTVPKDSSEKRDRRHSRLNRRPAGHPLPTVASSRSFPFSHRHNPAYRRRVYPGHGGLVEQRNPADGRDGRQWCPSAPRTCLCQSSRTFDEGQ